ncbi:phospholipase/carboxylesterase [Novosphingobium chloroacetimidivorans]|uniref:Phospholipase/carboxylesterase n=1 Tax=Novosphingobium chloroacetimidivorans TaxID=1428314 RepID=A0A7W7KCT0_9SPHN|nr:dienelactone hydrolase family protein [Novosphingobium chloroacetimidivorans]MBB4860160.1 phospholipase/carboxylesterase [Novosphingobium chloroacetimidivorans]
MTKIVNGASLQPLSGGAPKQIVLLLHGFGSSGSDMISLAPAWQHGFPDALFLAPHAPERTGGGGYQWWGLANLTPQALAAGTSGAAPVIDAFIDRKLAQYELSEADLAIVGFSQGTMMALQVGLRRRQPPACIVGYSGMLTGTADLRHGQGAKPPVLLVHGSADPVVPVAALHAAESELRRLGVEVTSHVSPGIGHTVDPVGLRLGQEFVGKALGVA